MAVQIILKNSSIEDKRPQASQLTNGEISLNYSSAGAFLCCTDTNGDVQQVGGIKIDETAPDAPVKQTLWFKPSTLTLSVFDGDKWLPIAGGGGGGGGGGGDIIQVIGNDGIDADTVAGVVTLDVELAGGDDGLEFKSSKLSATLASATDLGSVKVGDNINVTAGKISVPKATSSTFGVVKLGDGIEIDGDGSISIDVPTTTTYRGSCDLNNPPTGQINPDPALKGDAYINSAETPAVDAGWTGITGTAEIGDLVIFDGTTWDLIPLGAGTAPVTSVNGKTGDVVLDYTDVGAASEAQGDLADTALQPGDNISELNNDEGYITAAEAPVQSVNGKTGVVVLDAADVGALAPGDNVSLLANDAEYISKGDPVSDLDNDAGYITLADLPDIPDQEPPVIISDTAPTGDDAVAGNLWFNSNDGRTYIYYKDGDSSQWVDASPDQDVKDEFWKETGNDLEPIKPSNNVVIGTDKITLNADGSAQYLGKIGVNRSPSSLAWIGVDIPDADKNYGVYVRTKDALKNRWAYATGNGTTATGLWYSEGDLQIGTALDSDDPTAVAKKVELKSDGSGTFIGDLQSTSQNGGQLAGFRNQLVNSDFRFWERGDGPFSKPAPADADLYTADRWTLGRDIGRNGTLTKQTNPANIPVGLNGAVKVSANAEALIQKIELTNNRMSPFAPGQTWTVSLWADVDISSTTPFMAFRSSAGTVGTTMTGSAFAKTHDPVDNGYSRYSSQFTINTPPDIGIDLVSLMLGIRSHRDDFLNVDIRYSGIQLEIGPVATPFEHRPYGTELLLCQRYFVNLLYSRQHFFRARYVVGNSFKSVIQQLPTRMRAKPTSTCLKGWNLISGPEVGGLFWSTPDDWTIKVDTQDLGVYYAQKGYTSETEVLTNHTDYYCTANYDSVQFHLDAEL